MYFIGQAISLTGGWMQNVAQAWLVLHLTHSGTALGIVSALQCGPSLILGPYAGVVGTRTRKKRVLLATQSVSGLLALVLGILVLTDTAQAWMVYVMAALLGIVNAVDYPIRQAIVYELTGPEDVVSAIGLTGTAVNVARIAGPALAGVMIATVGMAACFLLNAASFVAVLVCLIMMRTSEMYHPNPQEPEGGVTAGLAYACRTPLVREALLMMAIVGVFTFEFSVSLPMLAKFTFRSGAAGLASLMSAMGVGAVVGGLYTAGKRGEGLEHLTTRTLAFGVSTALVGLAPSLPAATALMVLVGFFSARFTGLSSGILQLEASSTVRTRMVALWSTAFMGSALLGAPLIGWVGEVAGARSALMTGLLGGMVAAAVGWRGLRAAESAGARVRPSLAGAEHRST